MDLGRGGVLPSYGQVPHTARGRGCCPGCTGSYSQPGCAPAGASPLVTSFQNRCGFWKGNKQEQLHLTHLPKMAITHVTHHNQPYRSNSTGLQYIYVPPLLSIFEPVLFFLGRHPVILLESFPLSLSNEMVLTGLRDAVKYSKNILTFTLSHWQITPSSPRS